MYIPLSIPPGVYKNGTECTNDLANFPHSLWGVVQSVENLTPRGLQSTFSSNEENQLENLNYILR